MKVRAKRGVELAGYLRRWADSLEKDETVEDFQIDGHREPVELNPMAGECEFDGIRHFVAGPLTTWTIQIHHKLEDLRGSKGPDYERLVRKEET